MRQVKTVLMPTDLSETSGAILNQALSLADESAAKLIILHVVKVLQPWELHFDDTGLPDPELHPWPADKVLREAARDLDQFLEREASQGLRGARVEKRIVAGDVAGKIAEVAREEGADLIVMARRPCGIVQRWLGGSTADRISREASCPVLLIAPHRPAATLTIRRPSFPFSGNEAGV
jgi:nucleotide-binding universal stress UspA family protein